MNESITTAVQRALPRAASKAFLAARRYVTRNMLKFFLPGAKPMWDGEKGGSISSLVRSGGSSH